MSSRHPLHHRRRTRYPLSSRFVEPSIRPWRLWQRLLDVSKLLSSPFDHQRDALRKQITKAPWAKCLRIVLAITMIVMACVMILAEIAQSCGLPSLRFCDSSITFNTDWNWTSTYRARNGSIYTRRRRIILLGRRTTTRFRILRWSFTCRFAYNRKNYK